ncbi:mutator type transposase [Tanacetum coccineum]
MKKLSKEQHASSVARPIVVESVVDPFDGLDEILDLDYDPKRDDMFDDDEHIVKEVHVNMNNFSFTTDPKHDISIGDVDVQEDNLDVIDYDLFGSDLDDGIDSERRIQLRELRRIGKQKNKDHVFKSLATNPNIHVRAVQDQMPKQFEVGVSKVKAFRAKRIASDIITGVCAWPGQILTAVWVDANNRIYPVAYAIVEAESKASWCWFLNLLEEDLAKATSEGEFKKKIGELKSFNSDAYDWLMNILLEQ